MAATYRLADDLDAPFLAGSSCSFGVFDGVHVGHRFIIEQTRRQAQEDGSAAVVLTFDCDPDGLSQGDALRKLMGDDERIEMLASCGVDAVAVIPFTRTLAAMEPVEFLDRCFGAHVPASLHVGCDFRFGARAAGTIDDLRAWGAGHGMRVDACDLLQADGAPVTSTRIRALLGEGEVEQANDLLGRDYELSGAVVPGRGEGHDMGFATANLNVPDDMRVLGDGVYAAHAFVDGARYKAAVSVGVSPTFADRATANMEVHLLDFNGDLYDADIRVSFSHRLRPMMRFDSPEALVETVKDDIAWVRANLH